MKKKILMVIGGLLLTLILGALGSGLWERLFLGDTTVLHYIDNKLKI